MYSANMSQLELFDAPQQDASNAAGFYLSGLLISPPQLANIFELSIDAFYAALYAYMSEMPINGEISRFVEKVGKADDRAAAARIAFDRGDADVLTVLGAARKVQVEIHRMTGFLRFSPDAQGLYTARCEPDYFILPALAEHFTLRFGETPWAIIDEKRRLCLCRHKDGEVRLAPVSATPAATAENGAAAETGCPVERLWRLYHRSVSNEGRKNPRLQRQFMPERYHKYLCEL